MKKSRNLLLFVLPLLFVSLEGFSQSLSVSSTSLQAVAQKSTISLQITSNTQWGIYGYESWIHPKTVWGSQNQIVYFDIDENAYMLNRSDSFTIYYTDAYGNYFSEIQVAINQTAHTLGIADSVIYIDAAKGSTAFLNIVSNSYWEITDIPNWLSVDNNFKNNSKTITFTAIENPLFSTRTATVTLHRLLADSTFVSGRISIYQSGSATGLSKENVYLQAAQGSSDNLMLLTNMSWSISGIASWLTFSKTAGSGSDMFSITAQQNATIYERSCTCAIQLSNGFEYLLHITQSASPYVFQLTQSATNFAPQANASISMNVVSNTYWGLGQLPEWIKPQPIFSFGDSSFSIQATANPYMLTRSATVLPYWLDENIKYLGHQELLLTQSANTVGLSDSVLYVASTLGSTATFAIYTSSTWQILNVPSWLSVSSTQGSGNATLSILATANPLTGIRKGIFTVRRTLSQGVFIDGTITVYQSAGTVGVSTNSIIVNASEGSTASFTVSFSGSYTILSQYSWLTVQPASTMGNKTITITANENPDIYERSSIITVTFNNGTSQTITVLQKASEPKFYIPSSIVVFSAAGGKKTISIESNTSWGFAYIPAWIQEQSVFEFKSKTITLTAQPNTNTSSRIDSVLCYWLDAYNQSQYTWILFWQLAPTESISQTFILSTGWNLISFNLIVPNNTVEAVFSPILDKVDIIKNNNGFYMPQNTSSLQSLVTISNTSAYLIKMKSPTSITVYGNQALYTYSDLRNSILPGWNLVGFPFVNAETIFTVFGADIKTVKNFDGFYQLNGSYNSLMLMEPSKGYFIYK